MSVCPVWLGYNYGGKVECQGHWYLIIYICQHAEQLIIVFINMFGLTLRTVAAKSLGKDHMRHPDDPKLGLPTVGLSETVWRSSWEKGAHVPNAT